MLVKVSVTHGSMLDVLLRAFPKMSGGSSQTLAETGLENAAVWPSICRNAAMLNQGPFSGTKFGLQALQKLGHLDWVEGEEGPARSRDILQATGLFEVVFKEGRLHAEQVTDGTQFQQGPIQDLMEVRIRCSHRPLRDTPCQRCHASRHRCWSQAGVLADGS